MADEQSAEQPITDEQILAMDESELRANLPGPVPRGAGGRRAVPGDRRRSRAAATVTGGPTSRT